MRSCICSWVVSRMSLEGSSTHILYSAISILSARSDSRCDCTTVSSRSSTTGILEFPKRASVKLAMPAGSRNPKNTLSASVLPERQQSVFVGNGVPATVDLAVVVLEFSAQLPKRSWTHHQALRHRHLCLWKVRLLGLDYFVTCIVYK